MNNVANAQIILQGAQIKLKYRENFDVGIDGMGMYHYVFANPNSEPNTLYSANNVCGEYTYSGSNIALNDPGGLYPNATNYIENTPDFSNSTYINGVNTIDLLLIQKHINTTTPFTSGWEFLSADATNDEVVDNDDLDEIEDLVLGITSSVSRTKWSWVPLGAATPTLSDPWSDVSLLNFAGYFGDNYGTTTPILNDLNKIVFKATKTGDINGSNGYLCIGAGYLKNPNISTNTRENIINSEFNTIRKNDLVNLELELSYNEDLYAYECHLVVQASDYEIISVLSNDLKDIQWYFNTSNNLLSILSYAKDEEEIMKAGTKSLKIQFKAKTNNSQFFKNVEISDTRPVVAANVTAIEINGFTIIKAISIEPSSLSIESINMLGNREVKVSAPSTKPSILQVFDMSGKVIYQKTFLMVRGINSLFLDDFDANYGLKILSINQGDAIVLEKFID
ncbi:MAG TPA: hypothetical protein PLY70_12165 [Saprospiraceae bacterium]|nr:hypothetical protein [Saprospiraceae bacterium]HPN69640.1 hypothetical protein [Saprospiraceae bacterium]